MCDREVVSQIVSPGQFKVKCRRGESLIWICISVYGDMSMCKITALSIHPEQHVTYVRSAYRRYKNPVKNKDWKQLWNSKSGKAGSDRL